MIIFLGGCQIVTKRAEGTAAETSQPLLVDEKYSLTADRKQFEELRKEVPEQKKKENDQQKKKKEEPQKQPQSKMNPREAEQRLKLLQQKEKETIKV